MAESKWGASQRRTGTLSGASSHAQRTLSAHAPPLRGPGPARPLSGTKAIRRAHFRLGHRAPGRGGRRARTVSGCVNSAFLNISQHFTGHLFRPWIPSSAHGIDGGPRRFAEVVLNEQSLPVAGSGGVSWPAPVHCGQPESNPVSDDGQFAGRPACVSTRASFSDAFQ